MPGGVDEQRPDEEPDDDEREVLQPVDERLLERRLVEHGDVPRDEHGEPERDGDGRPEEERQRRPEPGASRERREQVTREEEHRQRPAHREERERHAEVGDQHVLEHVRRLEVLLGDRVERRDEADEHDGDARRGRAGSASTARARGRRRWSRRQPWRKNAIATAAAGQHERVERPGRPEVAGRRRREQGHRPTVALEGAWLEATAPSVPAAGGIKPRIRLRRILLAS